MPARSLHPLRGLVGAETGPARKDWEWEAAVSDYGPGFRMRWHVHDTAVLVLTLRGSVREEVGRYEAAAGPLEVGFKAPEVRHTDHYGPVGVRALRIRIGADAYAAAAAHANVAAPWLWTKRSPATKSMLRVAQAVMSGDASAAADNVAETLAALCPPRPASHSKWVDEIREELHDRQNERISLRDIARQRNVEPVLLARRFRRETGRSMTGYLRELRIRAAVRLLTTTIPLSMIAIRCGFYDQPHLTRSFRAELGMTPGAYRRLAASS